MKKLLAFALSLLLVGLFSSNSRAQGGSQGGYGKPCIDPGCATCCVNPTSDPLWPGPGLSVECATSNCSSPCGQCKQIRIRNMYDCKNIVKIEFDGHKITGQTYSICNTYQEIGSSGPCEGVSWRTPSVDTAGTRDPSQTWLNPCWLEPAGPPGEHWWITPLPAGKGPCPGGLAYGSWIYIDFCGGDVACDKITWTVYFSDGSTCQIDMGQVPSCCP